MSDRADWPWGMSEGWTDLGDEHLIRPTLDKSGRTAGYYEAHRDSDGRWCMGFVARSDRSDEVDGGGPEWDVLSEEPLTLSPSILCRGCGNHGWIRDGRWVPA